jgi:acyl-CoA synthetase (AMP-forming)/AMP-acid ligase II
LAQGVKPGDLVAFYLQNSPDFMFAWFGLLAIGAAPAMINYNLGGKALLHCLKISGAKLMLVDADPELQGRIDEVQAEIDSDIGIRCMSLGADLKREIFSLPALRPGEEYRRGLKGSDPMCLFYTR